MLLFLSGCALISKDDFDWRTNLGSTDSGTDSGDSGEGGGRIEISGSLDMLSEYIGREALPQASVGVLRFQFDFDAQPGDPFAEMFDFVDTAEVEDLSPGVSRPFQLSVPLVPPDEHLYDIDGVQGVTYMLAALSDDGNGAMDAADTYVGANVTDLLIYTTGGSNAEFGEDPGWYLISIPSFEGGGIEDIFPIEDDFFVWDVESNLLPRNTANDDVPGKLETELPDGDVGVTLWNVEFFEELFKGEATDRPPTHGTAEVDGDGRFVFRPIGFPAKEALSSTGVDGADYSSVGLLVGTYVGLAWADDGDLELNYRGDERPFAYSSAAGNQSKAFVWYEPIGFEAAFMLQYGVEVGWNVISAFGDNEGEILDWSENQLVLGDEGT